MKPIVKYSILVSGLVAGTYGLLLFLFTPPKGYIYYFPENYAGWICIQHGANGASPLPEQDGYLIIKVPASGIFKTSSLLRTSPTQDKHYYYNGTQIKDAKGLEFGGGGTIQSKPGERTIIEHFWISNNATRDYNLYIKRNGFGFDNIPCGPFVK